MALASSDQFALYRYQDATNYRTSLNDITTFVQATTASTLQAVTDNGNETTNALVVLKTDPVDDAFVVKLDNTETFWVTGAGFVEFTGDLLVNNRSGIAATGVVTAYRPSTTGTDVLQKWQSNVGATPATVGTLNCQGDLTIAGSFIGDGSQLDNITQDLQSVCTAGNVTNTGADFGGEVKINRPNDTDRGFVVQKAGVDTFLVTTQGTVYVGGDDTNATATINSDGSASFDSSVTVGTGDTSGTAGIFLAPAGTVNVANDAANQIFVGRTSGSSAITSQITGTGAAIFNTSVQAAGSPISGAAAGVVISGTEGVTSGVAAAANPVWRGYTQGTAVATSTINADGTASFTGTVTGGADADFTGNADFDGDGSFGGDGDFTGTLSAGTIANTVPLSAWTDIPLLT